MKANRKNSAVAKRMPKTDPVQFHFHLKVETRLGEINSNESDVDFFATRTNQMKYLLLVKYNFAIVPMLKPINS